MVLLATVYACSGTVDVTARPGGGIGASAGQGGSSASGGSASGGMANAGSGGTIDVGKGGSAAHGGKGGTGGRGGTGGDSSLGGEAQGGYGVDYNAAGLPGITFDYEPDNGGQGGACATETGTAVLRKRPMDVIVSIDNSESMSGEIQEVQKRINTDFANILAQSGIDYRVILVSRYGNVFVHNQDSGNAADSAYSVCIGSPLSTIACPANATDPTPPVANNPPKFYHHSTDISSHNMWCRLTESYTTKDAISTHGHQTGWVSVAPNGWKDFVRTGAYKVFIGITDDQPDTSSQGCPGSGFTSDLAGATAFDTALRALDRAQFETADGQRNYVWYSIVGMHDASMDAPLLPTDPIETKCCTKAGTPQNMCQGTTGTALENSAYPGVGYQELSIMTGGLRYPSCYTANFNGIFNKIAEGVIDQASASCQYDVPSPAHGIVDFAQTQVSYKPGSGAAVPLSRRNSDTACNGNEGFYFNDDKTQINLCPATCTVVQADPNAKVTIDFGCLGS